MSLTALHRNKPVLTTIDPKKNAVIAIATRMIMMIAVVLVLTTVAVRAGAAAAENHPEKKKAGTRPHMETMVVIMIDMISPIIHVKNPEKGGKMASGIMISRTRIAITMIGGRIVSTKITRIFH